MVRWKILVCRKKHFSVKEHMFTIVGKLTKANIDIENRIHELQVQIQELKGELETLHQTLGKVFQTSYIDN